MIDDCIFDMQETRVCSHRCLPLHARRDVRHRAPASRDDLAAGDSEDNRRAWPLPSRHMTEALPLQQHLYMPVACEAGFLTEAGRGYTSRLTTH